MDSQTFDLSFSVFFTLSIIALKCLKTVVRNNFNFNSASTSAFNLSLFNMNFSLEARFQDTRIRLENHHLLIES